jgi:hypothetical protein
MPLEPRAPAPDDTLAERLEVRLDPDGPGGDPVEVWAELLLAIARRRVAARSSPGKEGLEEREKSEA